MSRRHRVGVVGCGEVARYGHLPALSANDRFTVSAICDISPERLAAVRAPAGAARCSSLDELPELDALVVTSPVGVHADHVAWAARRGLPVLCEKPLSFDETSARAMVGLMEDADAPLYVGFTYRFAPVALRIRELVAAGAVGRVRAMRLVYLWDLHGAHADRSRRRGTNERRTGRMLEGGPLLDCGVHQIDLARWWLGTELTVEAARGVWFEEYDAPDHVIAHLSGGGAHVMVEVSVAYGHTAAATSPSFGYEVIGTEGVLRYRRDEHEFVRIGSAGVEDLGWTPEKSFPGMYENLAAALDGRSHAMPTGLDGVTATGLARAATTLAIGDRPRR